MNLLLASEADFWTTTNGQILAMVICILFLVMLSFFVYFILYYICRGIEILFEPTFKRKKIEIDIPPVVGILLSFLLVVIVAVILIFTVFPPSLLNYFKDMFDAIFG